MTETLVMEQATHTEPTIRRALGGLEVGVLLYYAAFFIYAFGVLLLTTNARRSGFESAGQLAVYLKFAAFLLLVFKISAFQRQSIRQWVVIVVLGVLGLLSYVVTDEPLMLAIVLFVAAAKGVNYRVLAGLALSVNLLVLFIVIVGYQAGILNDFVMSRNGAVGVRHSYGFAHPNSLGICLASACVSLFVLRGNRIGVVEAVIGAACYWVIVEMVDSRTAALGVVLAYVLFFAWAHLRGPVARRVLGLALSVIVVVVVALSLYFMVSYDSSRSLDSLINETMSGRMRLAHYYFQYYPPGILGQNTDLVPVISLYSSTTFLVDNAYARLYLRYGPVFLVIILACLAVFFWRVNRSGTYGVVLVGIAFAAIYGFSEYVFLRPEFNYFMVIGFSWLLYGFPNADSIAERENIVQRGRPHLNAVSGDIQGESLASRKQGYSDAMMCFPVSAKTPATASNSRIHATKSSLHT